MARSLELRVVAEGVETLEELEFLRTHQCDEAQGYYFSRPVPPQQFAELLRTGISKPGSVPRRAAGAEPDATEARGAPFSVAASR
jgi:predicted signal transduction protein with EAL and GGDEF domain